MRRKERPDRLADVGMSMMTLGCRHVRRSSGVHGAGRQGAGAEVAAAAAIQKRSPTLTDLVTGVTISFPLTRETQSHHAMTMANMQMVSENEIGQYRRQLKRHDIGSLQSISTAPFKILLILLFCGNLLLPPEEPRYSHCSFDEDSDPQPTHNTGIRLRQEGTRYCAC